MPDVAPSEGMLSTVVRPHPPTLCSVLAPLCPPSEQVPYDPGLRHSFFGEEVSMAARMFTRGWDFFAPPQAVVYHLWSRGHRPSFRQVLFFFFLCLGVRNHVLVGSLGSPTLYHRCLAGCVHACFASRVSVLEAPESLMAARARLARCTGTT